MRVTRSSADSAIFPPPPSVEVRACVDTAALSSQRFLFFVQIQSAMGSAGRFFLFVFVLVDFTSGATSAEMEAGATGGTGE